MNKNFRNRVLTLSMCVMLLVSLISSNIMPAFAEDNVEETQTEMLLEGADEVTVEPEASAESANSESIEGSVQEVDPEDAVGAEGVEDDSLPILRGPKVDIDGPDVGIKDPEPDVNVPDDDVDDSDEKSYEPIEITIPIAVQIQDATSDVVATVMTPLSLIYNTGDDPSGQVITKNSVDITGEGSDAFKIKFSRPGTYYYSIWLDESDSRFDYSSWGSDVTVIVEEGDDGTLRANFLQGEEYGINHDIWTEEYLLVLNAYTSTQFSITIMKEVVGDTTQPGTFRFGASLQNNAYKKMDLPEDVEITVSGGSSAEAVMGPFEITSQGSYQFTIWEADPNSLGNADLYAQQTAPYELWLEVGVDDDLNLVIVDAQLNGAQVPVPTNGMFEVPLMFANMVVTEDTDSVEQTISVDKITVGDGFPSDEEFQFEIEAIDGAPLPEETIVSRQGEGLVEFSPITYYREGIYRYKVREIAGSHSQIDYDPTEWTVEIVVERSDVPKADVDISSVLTPASESIMKPAEDELLFAGLQIDVGDDEPGDTELPGLTITYAEGSIENSYGYWINLLEGESLRFINVFYNVPITAEIPVKKIVELGENADGNKPETPETFTFKIEAVGDAPMPDQDIISITTDEEGLASFEINYSLPGEYKYQISEVAGESPHYTYDSASWIAIVYIDPEINENTGTFSGTFADPDIRVYPSEEDGNRMTECENPYPPDPDVTVTSILENNVSAVKDSYLDENIDLSMISVVIDPIDCRPVSEEGGIVFTNIYNPVETIEISGEKIWEDENDRDGIRPDAIEITLYRFDKVYRTMTVTAEDGWTFTFADLPKYCPKGNEYTYRIEETPVEGYETSYDGYNIINTHEVEPEEPNKPSEPKKSETPKSSPKQSVATSPRTGDESHMTLYGILMMMSVVLLTGTVVLKKKRQH